MTSTVFNKRVGKKKKICRSLNPMRVVSEQERYIKRYKHVYIILKIFLRVYLYIKCLSVSTVADRGHVDFDDSIRSDVGSRLSHAFSVYRYLYVQCTQFTDRLSMYIIYTICLYFYIHIYIHTNTYVSV